MVEQEDAEAMEAWNGRSRAETLRLGEKELPVVQAFRFLKYLRTRSQRLGVSAGDESKNFVRRALVCFGVRG